MAILDFSFLVYLALTPIWILLPIIIQQIGKLDGIKKANNIRSAIHATIVIIFYLFGGSGVILNYISSTYYIADLVNIIIQFKPTLYNFGIAIHHVVTMTVLTYLCFPETQSYLYIGFFLSELSNVPMYIVYHLKENHVQGNIVTLLTGIEALGFIVCRILIGGKLCIDITLDKNMPWIMSISGWIIFVISFYWSYKLIMQIVRYKKIKQL
jgi:hypothetical protein